MTPGLPGLELRPVRPAEREQVLELAREPQQKEEDYLEGVFDRWVTDPGGEFQAAELDGELVGVQRMRPIGPGIVFYEGLRVAPSQRRRGLARAMLRQAMEGAAGQGFGEMRLVAQSPAAIRLFESEGFGALARCRARFAARQEGVDSPRLGSPAEGERLAALAAQDGALAAYGGVVADWRAPLDIDAALLARLAGEGLVRVGPSGRSFALLLGAGPSRLGVGFVAGSGAALGELLAGLRVEADAGGLRGVRLWSPDSLPAAGDVEAVGYHLEDDSPAFAAFGRKLTP
jgi:ribosomal protein S18 acetylase RimI-like enzyme